MAGRKRTLAITAAAVAVAIIGGFGLLRDNSAAQEITVYKTPTCGCCGKWVDHLKAAGYEVTVSNLSDLTEIKNLHGVPMTLRTCHTGIVNGYVVEGHVPARFVTRLIEEKPAIAGIAVPGMPIGSPGMEGPYRESYDVVSFDSRGETAVFGHVEGDEGR